MRVPVFRRPGAEPLGVQRPVSPLALALVFGVLSITTYGGAQSAAIQRAVVRQRGWLSEEEFLTFRALAQLSPGGNSPNLAVLLGRRLAGLPGAVAAFVGATLPGTVIILALGMLSLDPHLPLVRGALRGCAAAAVGVSLAAAIELSVPYRRRAFSLAIVVGTVVATVAFRVPLLLTCAIGFPLSVAIAVRERR